MTRLREYGAERATKVPLQAKGLVPRTNPVELSKVDPVPIAIALHEQLSTLNDTDYHGSKAKKAGWCDQWKKGLLCEPCSRHVFVESGEIFLFEAKSSRSL